MRTLRSLEFPIHTIQLPSNNNYIDYSIASELSNSEIIDEYANCDIVSFCSIFEGFGMPVIEAQASGRAVLTSNIEPITEIAGGGAIFIDPNKINEIRNGFFSIINNDILRKKIIQVGFENVKKYNSLYIAQKYIYLYENF